MEKIKIHIDTQNCTARHTEKQSATFTLRTAYSHTRGDTKGAYHFFFFHGKLSQQHLSNVNSFISNEACDTMIKKKSHL